MDYVVGADIELTPSEIKMLRDHGIVVLELDKMSKEELIQVQDWLAENGL